MDTPIADPWAGGSVHTDFRAVLLGDGTGNTPFWVRNLGGDPRMAKTLGGFHHRVARGITGQLPRQQADGSWHYPPLADAMGEAGMEELETYIARRQNMVAQYIATRPILDLCPEAERCPGARVAKRWWEQEGLSLAGAQEAAEAGGTGEADG